MPVADGAQGGGDGEERGPLKNPNFDATGGARLLDEGEDELRFFAGALIGLDCREELLFKGARHQIHREGKKYT